MTAKCACLPDMNIKCMYHDMQDRLVCGEMLEGHACVEPFPHPDRDHRALATDNHPFGLRWPHSIDTHAADPEKWYDKWLEAREALRWAIRFLQKPGRGHRQEYHDAYNKAVEITGYLPPTQPPYNYSEPK